MLGIEGCHEQLNGQQTLRKDLHVALRRAEDDHLRQAVLLRVVVPSSLRFQPPALLLFLPQIHPDH